MFANLIESASHQRDLARKGRFFLATLISYALIVACAGLASIYAYDAQLEENQDLVFLGLVLPVVPEAATPKAKSAGPKAKNNNQRITESQRTVAIERIETGAKIPDVVSSHKSDIPEIPLGRFTIGNSNVDAELNGPLGTGPNDGSGGGGPVSQIKIETTPPPKNEAATQPKKEVITSGGVVNSRALHLPKPEYTTLAKRALASGPVNVQVMIDETGKVISARATVGHPLLRGPAVRAAFQTRFSPTLLSGVPVKVSGIINYNFSLQ